MNTSLIKEITSPTNPNHTAITCGATGLISDKQNNNRGWLLTHSYLAAACLSEFLLQVASLESLFHAQSAPHTAAFPKSLEISPLSSISNQSMVKIYWVRWAGWMFKAFSLAEVKKTNFFVWRRILYSVTQMLRIGREHQFWQPDSAELLNSMDYKQSIFSLIAAVTSARDCILTISSLPLQDKIRNHKTGKKTLLSYVSSQSWLWI